MSKPASYRAASYVWLIPYLTEVARECGYALGVHGSLHRDLDLLAMPWTDEAKSPAELIEIMRQRVGGIVHADGTPAGRYDPEKGEFVAAVIENPSRKPHGRLAWNIHLDAGLFLDISVMPLSRAAEVEGSSNTKSPVAGGEGRSET